ncbi:hypothetical protein [Puniceibacterium sediminis]|uniref:Uncharacterized protein n=1 Tax=Puniceibacterium sediminis TaxID=1608407 RepID=A0A238XJ75_9RHOB|nr:hypothetical protein [Puniceibacterium sediminis]SNR58638.1 hypothetical protein SAMN06265370_111115 [Puniceibacterium sediminis]
MTQIEELERRITAALDRIAQGVEALDNAPAPVPEEPEPEVPMAEPDAPTAEVDTAELESLRDALNDEKVANAQLEERLSAVRAKQESGVKDLHAQVAKQRESLGALDLDLQHLRRANDMLVNTIQELRTALEENVGEPNLINKAMLAELESLRAARTAEAAEARAVLDALEPLLVEASNNPAEESA